MPEASRSLTSYLLPYSGRERSFGSQRIMLMLPGSTSAKTSLLSQDIDGAVSPTPWARLLEKDLRDLS